MTARKVTITAQINVLSNIVVILSLNFDQIPVRYCQPSLAVQLSGVFSYAKHSRNWPAFDAPEVTWKATDNLLK
jgi:hypothetical protein